MVVVIELSRSQFGQNTLWRPPQEAVDRDRLLFAANQPNAAAIGEARAICTKFQVLGKLVVNAPQDEPANRPMPRFGRLAGIDYGSVRVGIATCDPSQTWAAPWATYTRRNERLDRLYFSQLVEQEHVVGWIVGLPIHCDGAESVKSLEARRFADWLQQISALPVALFDERFTTAEARRLLNESSSSAQKKKKRLDGIAAHLILSHYLDSQRNATFQNEALEDVPPPPE